MPELPEVRAHAARLDAEFRGRALEAFKPITFTALKTAVPPVSDALGHEIDGISSRGKFLLLGLTNDHTFVVHLMQGGRLTPDTRQAARPRGGLCRWVFDDGPALLLTEAGTERKAGTWLVAGDPQSQEPLAGLGPEADQVDRDALRSILASTSGRLHGVLRDQHVVAGIGRRLANEICHTAKLSPFAAANRLDDDEVAALHWAIAAEIGRSLEFEEQQSEMVASAKRPASVHHRTGEPCPVCGDAVRAVEYRAYTVNYCPTCQTGGKVLADNTTSRFLR